MLKLSFKTEIIIFFSTERGNVGIFDEKQNLCLRWNLMWRLQGWTHLWYDFEIWVEETLSSFCICFVCSILTWASSIHGRLWVQARWRWSFWILSSLGEQTFGKSGRLRKNREKQNRISTQISYPVIICAFIHPASRTKILLRRVLYLSSWLGFPQFDKICLFVWGFSLHKRHVELVALPHFTRFSDVGSSNSFTCKLK